MIFYHLIVGVLFGPPCMLQTSMCGKAVDAEIVVILRIVRRFQVKSANCLVLSDDASQSRRRHQCVDRHYQLVKLISHRNRTTLTYLFTAWPKTHAAQ